MRKFNMVNPAIWNSPTYRALPDDARFLHLFFITSGHQTACGCFALPDGYATTDIVWGLERYQSARESLVASNLIAFDKTTSEVLIHKWFRHNPPMNPNHRKCIADAIEQIRSERLRNEALSGLAAAENEACAKREAASSARASRGGLWSTSHMARVRV